MASKPSLSITGSIVSHLSTKSWSKMVQELEDIQIINHLDALLKETRTLEIENTIYYNFFVRNEPSAFEGMEPFIEKVNQAHHRQSISRKMTKRVSMMSTKSKGSIASARSMSAKFSSKMSMQNALGPLTLSSRLTPKQKSELIYKECEFLTNGMEETNQKHKRRKRRLLTILEELDMREEIITHTIDIFNDTFFPEGPQIEIQNEPFKMMRFIEDWNRRAQRTIDKLRLRTSSLKVQYQKLCGQLTQKQLQGKNLQKVDFEYLHIDNKHLVVDIDKKLKLLIELKRMTGKVNSTLSRQKTLLSKKMKELAEKQELLKFKEDKVQEFDLEFEKLTEEVDTTRIKHNNAHDRLQLYEPPDVMQYLRNKAELTLLKKNITTWKRRKQIKDMALNSCVREINALMKEMHRLMPRFSSLNDFD